MIMSASCASRRTLGAGSTLGNEVVNGLLAHVRASTGLEPSGLFAPHRADKADRCVAIVSSHRVFSLLNMCHEALRASDSPIAARRRKSSPIAKCSQDPFGMLRVSADDGVEDAGDPRSGRFSWSRTPEEAPGDRDGSIRMPDSELCSTISVSDLPALTTAAESRNRPRCRRRDRRWSRRCVRAPAEPLEIGHGGPLGGKPDGLAFDRDARLHHVVDDVRSAARRRR